MKFTALVNKSGFALTTFMGGIAVGIIVAALLIVQIMPSTMLSIHQSRYDSIEDTVAALQETIKKHGWSSPGIRNMNKTMAKHGIPSQRQVRLAELCKAKYANEVLKTNPEVATLMPCAWGVYKGDDGKVYITGMNMGLMGKMFGGKIAEIMGGFVAREEHAMLAEVVKK
jgi:uncharacterized protein (DUF302 family)